MEFQLVQECRSNEGWQPIKVPSSSDPDKYYVVLTAPWLSQREYICECEGYRFREYCRHQQEATAMVCGWSELAGPEKQSLYQQQQLICPRCEEPTRRVMEIVDG